MFCSSLKTISHQVALKILSKVPKPELKISFF